MMRAMREAVWKGWVAYARFPGRRVWVLLLPAIVYLMLSNMAGAPLGAASSVATRDEEAVDGLRFSAADWNLYTLPSNTDDIRIDGSNVETVVHLDVDFTVGSRAELGVIGASRLKPFQTTLIVDTGVTVDGTFENNYADFVNDSTVIVNGTLVNEGQPDIKVASFTNNGALTNAGLVSNAGSPFSLSTDVEQYGLFTDNGTFDNINGTVSNAG